MKTTKSVDLIVKEWLYPTGEKEDTPQMRSPAAESDQTSSEEEEWASKAQVERLQAQLTEMHRFVNSIVKKHAKDIDGLKALARLAQRNNGSTRDELNQVRIEVAESLNGDVIDAAVSLFKLFLKN